jgi:hypothetical protein
MIKIENELKESLHVGLNSASKRTNDVFKKSINDASCWIENEYHKKSNTYTNIKLLIHKTQIILQVQHTFNNNHSP